MLVSFSRLVQSVTGRVIILQSICIHSTGVTTIFQLTVPSILHPSPILTFLTVASCTVIMRHNTHLEEQHLILCLGTVNYPACTFFLFLLPFLSVIIFLFLILLHGLACPTSLPWAIYYIKKLKMIWMTTKLPRKVIRCIIRNITLTHSPAI